MRATSFTHVSIHAYDLEESTRFYVDVFGMRRVPAPDFEHPVVWLEVGDQQLHLFHRDTPAPSSTTSAWTSTTSRPPTPSPSSAGSSTATPGRPTCACSTTAPCRCTCATPRA